MDTDRYMAVFRELLRCGGEIYTWCYDADGNLLESNCPDEGVLAAAFSVLGCHERMMSHWKDHTTPITLGSDMALAWNAAFEEKDGRPYRAWVIGPVFYTEVSMHRIREGFLNKIGVEADMVWKHRFIEVLFQIQSVPHVVFSRYLLMLHYCLTGERLLISDTTVLTAPNALEPSASVEQRDRHKIWSAEQGMLQMVRNGDLDYRQALSLPQQMSNGVPLRSEDPLRKGKVSNIVFCSIVCRAAIEGGLSPEVAYALGDSYIQMSEDAGTPNELESIAMTMYDDFVRRVNKCRTNPKLSPAIQKCVDYIEMHLGERILAADLAAIAGYSEYYTTLRFRKETGFSINSYIKFAKIERAKILLRSTELDVREIAATLGFSSRSHFSQSFKQVTGQSPIEFRTQLTEHS